jgi:transcriptional regulator with XRE-family HTH domain/transposase-like protein
MSKVGDSGGTPRAIVHKRILDVAASQPDASLAEIAGEISAATPDLVERVLDEYGDPAGDEPEVDDPTTEEEPEMLENGQPADDEESTAEEASVDTGEAATEPPNEDGLTEKQRETARVVHRHPHASQQKIADELGVTPATVSRRLNEIPEFEWKNRAAITAALFGERPDAEDAEADADLQEQPTEGDDEETEPPAEAATAETASDDSAGANVEQATETTKELAALDDRVTELETQMSEDSESERTAKSDVALPPELAHKVVHAAMASEQVSEEEELELLQALLG